MRANIQNSQNLRSCITRRARTLLFQDAILLLFDMLNKYKTFVRNRFFNKVNPFYEISNLLFLPSNLDNWILQQKETH